MDIGGSRISREYPLNGRVMTKGDSIQRKDDQVYSRVDQVGQSYKESTGGTLVYIVGQYCTWARQCQFEKGIRAV